MGRTVVGLVLSELVGRVSHWRRRQVRAEARELRATYGEDAVRILRERIAAADRHQERRRLYRLHDEIARAL